MRLHVPICLALAFALLAAPAGAQSEAPVTDPTLGRYMEIAKAYWGAEPSCTQPDGTVIHPYAVMGNDPNPNVAAWAEVGGCRMWLDRDYWPAPPSEEYCNLIAHEWGHLTGRPHSDDPDDLMWPQWINDVVPQCAEFRQAGLEAPPTATAASSRARRHHAKRARRARRACMAARKRQRRAQRRSVRRRVHHRRCSRRAKRRHRHRVAAGSVLETRLSQRPISLDGPLTAPYALSPSGS
jgi:hypothetical protein